MVEHEGKSIRKISKAELFEVSIVGVPMNQDSLFELSAKSLATKSFHQVKSEILKAKGADKASEMEEILGSSPDRKGSIHFVAAAAGLEVSDVLEMLAGDKELTKEVEECIRSSVKAANLKEILEAALAQLSEGATTDAVQESLLAAMNGDSDEEADETEEGKADEGEEEEGEGSSEEEGTPSDETEKEGSGESEEESSETDLDAKLKADFQDCVSAMVPKLLEEGMEQDQAVAAAISKCQEEGKCQLTPESKQATFAALFESLDKMDKSAFGPITFTNEIISFVKQVDEAAQSDQPPTTPIKTEPAADDFGNPFLESSKQTNVLLGALINEIQKLSSKFDGIVSQSSVQSSEDTSKGQEESSETVVKPETEDQAEKRLSDLNLRLKNLGC
jgi:hypothetical protein